MIGLIFRILSIYLAFSAVLGGPGRIAKYLAVRQVRGTINKRTRKPQR